MNVADTSLAGICPKDGFCGGQSCGYPNCNCRKDNLGNPECYNVDPSGS